MSTPERQQQLANVQAEAHAFAQRASAEEFRSAYVQKSLDWVKLKHEAEDYIDRIRAKDQEISRVHADQAEAAAKIMSDPQRRFWITTDSDPVKKELDNYQRQVRTSSIYCLKFTQTHLPEKPLHRKRRRSWVVALETSVEYLGSAPTQVALSSPLSPPSSSLPFLRSPLVHCPGTEGIVKASL